MAIHGTLDPYASDDMRRDLPKYTMPNTGMESDTAFNLVKDALLLDGVARQNLAT